MNHAEICPVCHGTGKIQPDIGKNALTAVPMPQTCHGCSGRGWVEVGLQPPIYPYPYHPYPYHPVHHWPDFYPPYIITYWNS